MKKNRTRQLMCAALTISMAAGMMLTGCGSSDTAADNTGSGAVSTGTAAQESSAENTQTAESFSIWSNTTKPWTGYTDASQSPFHTGLNEKTGITWNWEWPAEGTDVSTAFNLMLAGDTLPDVIYYRANHRNASQYLQDGMIIALNDYMEYAPNLQKLFDENEDIRKDCMTDDGQIYMFPMVNETYALTTAGPAIRKDWLDELGLPMPVTYDDWETTLKAFKENYGATFATIDDLYWFGFLGGTREYIRDENGKVQFGYTLDSTRKSLEILARWQQEGFLDPDFASLDNNMVKQKMENGEVGISFVYDISDTQAAQGWVALPYPVEKEGDVPEYSRMTTRVDYGYGAMITTACQDIPSVVKALDWAYGEEGSLYWNCGEEGTDYTLDADGNVTFTDKILKNPELDSREALWQDSAFLKGGPMIRLQKAKEAIINEATADCLDKWSVSNMQNHMMPLITQTKEETDQISSKLTAISSYAEEMWFSFISGDTELTDDSWNAFKQQLDSLGLQDVLTAKQAALDRYNAR